MITNITNVTTTTDTNTTNAVTPPVIVTPTTNDTTSNTGTTTTTPVTTTTTGSAVTVATATKSSSSHHSGGSTHTIYATATTQDTFEGWTLKNMSWYYRQSDGTYKTGWFTDSDGYKYYLLANGEMVTGYYTVDGVTYQFSNVIDGHRGHLITANSAK